MTGNTIPVLTIAGPRLSGRIIFFMCPYCLHEHAHRLTIEDLNREQGKVHAADCGLGQYIFCVAYPEEHVPPHPGPGIL